MANESLIRVIMALTILAFFLATGYYLPNWLLSRFTYVEVGFIQKIGTTLSIFLYVIGVISALSILSLSYTVIQIIFVLIVVGLLIAFRDALANVVGEIYIRFRTPFSRGEWVKIGDWEGRVTSINTFDVELAAPSGERIVVPNSLFLKEILVKKPKIAGNLAETSLLLRGVTIKEARKVIEEALQHVKHELSGDPMLKQVEREDEYVRVNVALPLLNILKVKQIVDEIVLQLRRKGYEAEAL